MPRDDVLAGHGLIDLPAQTISADEARLLHLSRALRFHWDEPVEEELFELRDSMDEALGFLALQELSIATGYLPLEEAWADARRRLAATLWPAAARGYVDGYGFIGVRMLAARVNVELGLPALQPPEPLPNGAIRFAGMLSELRIWYEDGPIDIWLSILDDFALSDLDKLDFSEALKNARPDHVAPDISFALLGAATFLSRLANLFDIMPAAERPLYGIYFSYWLAKFFGRSFDGGRFKRLPDEPNWPQLFSQSRLIPTDRRADIIGDVAILRATWTATYTLIEKLAAVEERADTREAEKVRARRRKPQPKDAPQRRHYKRSDEPVIEAAAEPAPEPARPRYRPSASAAEAPEEAQAPEPADAEEENEGGPRRGWWQRSFGQ
ncbi:hypothetical protein K9B33_11520 [Sphingobium sp. 3R8]|uniref:hypothetical protein n=1 Tax=Sphingobium sp. 3R8 TaxID=2874921 RepID=UPI001CCD98C0|nr:hypothetical protein [Sphingobium sp. 3R8]MBZ9648179.1 hypothetical protein [Sphingobium sp. 3R8]